MFSPHNHIVYFSTLSIYDKDSMYTNHKRNMETLVKDFHSYTIIRIGNITWGSNPNTILNWLKANPNEELRDEYKYLIDEAELLYWIDRIPNFSTEMNITGNRVHTSNLHKYIK